MPCLLSFTRYTICKNVFFTNYPLALRANPATVPGVKLVRLIKLVKLVTLSISNQTKIDQHRPQNRPKIVPKSIQNRPKIDQDRPKIELGWGLGAIWAPRWLREPTWPRNHDSLDPLGPPSWEPKLSKNHQKIDPKLNMFFDHFFDRFWNPLGTDLVGFWVPKWNQNWSRIGTKSDHEANANIFKFIGRRGVFEDRSCLESIKDRT